jgi:hypothetical protein
MYHGNRSLGLCCSTNLLNFHPVFSEWQNMVDNKVRRNVIHAEFLWETFFENISTEALEELRRVYEVKLYKFYGKN